MRRFSAGNRPVSLAVGDFNGDGLLDILVISGTLRVLLGNGDGTFSTMRVSYGVGIQPASPALGDFDGDHHPDVAVTVRWLDAVSIAFNNGVGPGPAPAPWPGEGRSPQGRITPAALDQFAAEAVGSRLGVRDRAAVLFAESPRTAVVAEPVRGEGSPRKEVAAEFRLAAVSRKGAEGFFAQAGREFEILNCVPLAG